MIAVELFEDDGVALVIVPDYQLSLAIGREGQNVRLAARLPAGVWTLPARASPRRRGSAIWPSGPSGPPGARPVRKPPRRWQPRARISTPSSSASSRSSAANGSARRTAIDPDPHVRRLPRRLPQHDLTRFVRDPQAGSRDPGAQRQQPGRGATSARRRAPAGGKEPPLPGAWHCSGRMWFNRVAHVQEMKDTMISRDDRSLR